MGLLFLGMAYGLINAEKYEIKALIDFGDFFRYFFAGICILYGLFRVYRGFKEQY